MAGERQIFWTSASAAGATVAAVAVAAVVIWNTAGKQHEQFVAELASLNAKLDATDIKIDKASATVAEIKKITAPESMIKQLGLLNSEIKKTNDGLAELQKASSLDDIKTVLAQINSRIEKTGAAAAEIKAASVSASNAQSAGDAALEKMLAKLETAIADLKSEVSDVKSGLAGSASSQAKAMEAIATSVNAPKTPAAAAPNASDLVVITVAKASTAETTGSVPAVPPMTVRFEKIGSTDDRGQTREIVANLKKIMKDRHDCAISVSGFADTLGTDDVNLDVSRERAEAVAAQLHTAFAGEKVQIKNVGWGERRLKVWTPDGKSEKANRRVDISVDCKS